MSLFALGTTAAILKTATSPPAGNATSLTKDADRTSEADAAKEHDQNPLAALALFVPAETVAIFVTVATALLLAFPDAPVTASRIWYAFCIVLTPVFAWIGFATQWRKDHDGNYPTTAVAPWFRIAASMIAFAAWGLAVAPKIGSAILCPNNFHAAAAATNAAAAGAATSAAGATAAVPACNAESLSGILVVIVGVILTALDGLVDYTPKKS